MFKRYFISLVGIIIYAISLNNLLHLNVGKRPQDLLILTLQKLFHSFSYVTIYLMIEIFFLCLLIIFFKKLHSNVHEIIVSFISILFLSVLIDATSNFVFQIHGVIAFILIMLFVNLGLSLIAYANIIITPLDKFLLHLSKNISLSYGHTRLAFDIIIFISVIIFNFVVFKSNILNWQTIILIIATGPIIHYYEVIFRHFFKIKVQE